MGETVAIGQVFASMWVEPQYSAWKSPTMGKENVNVNLLHNWEEQKMKCEEHTAVLIYGLWGDKGFETFMGLQLRDFMELRATSWCTIVMGILDIYRTSRLPLRGIVFSFNFRQMLTGFSRLITASWLSAVSLQLPWVRIHPPHTCSELQIQIPTEMFSFGFRF